MNGRIASGLLAGCLVLFSASVAGPVRAAEEPKKAEPAAETLTPDQLNDLYQQAVRLMLNERFDEAVKNCQRILAQKPDDPHTKKLLGEIAANRRRVEGADPSQGLRQQLNKVILDEVNFRAAALRDIIDYLQQESRRRMADKNGVNFVWLLPADAKVPTVSLNLKNIPLLDVVDYSTKAAGLAYRVDPRAVVIFKPEPPAAPAKSDTTDRHVVP